MTEELTEYKRHNSSKTVSENDPYKVELETISKKLYTLTKENQSLERHIKTFEQLDPTERLHLRESLQENTKLSAQLQKILSEFEKKYIKTGVAARKAKTAHENSSQALKKEWKKLELLTKQIVFKEKELLGKYKQTQEFQRLSVSGLEKKGLLEMENESDTRVSGGYEENKGETQKGNAAVFLQDFIVKQQEAMEVERQEKIMEVCDSLQNINKLFEDLREIVVEQESTLNQYEKNVEEAARHTGKAVEQLIKTEQRTKYSNTKLLIFALTICLLLTLMWVIHSYSRP